ncbi:MAG: pentapeptide repeat-containing protein, partial [Cellvibrionaceae bacterium]|nr:pentapeptide repeat-containing protein [Cellvibrionaceae bacterium]
MVFLDDEYVSESFNDLDLKGAEVSAKQFDSCVFTQCNFSEVKLNRTSFVDCEFTNFNLSLLKINYGKFVDVQFRCSRLIGIDWTKVAWPNLALNAPLSFMDCNLSDGSFFGLSLLGLVMHECKAHNADFREGNFSHADFRNTDFSD